MESCLHSVNGSLSPARNYTTVTFDDDVIERDNYLTEATPVGFFLAILGNLPPVGGISCHELVHQMIY
jgi:hypothetical protein